MKRISAYTLTIAACLWAALSLSSCTTEDTTTPDGGEMIDGMPVTVSLPWGAGMPVTLTKADGDDTVSDLYVLLFNEYGRHEGNYYFSVADGTLNPATRKVQLQATSGKKIVLALANVQASNFNSPASGKSLKQEIDAYWANGTHSLTDWLAEGATMVANRTDWSPTELLMSGRYATAMPVVTDTYAVTADNSEVCAFKIDGTVARADGSLLGDNAKVWLTRTIASVTFRIQTGTYTVSVGGQSKEVTFEPQSYSVCNLPNAVSLYAGTQRTAQVFTPDANSFDGKIDGNSFQFFMLENRQAKGTALNEETREALRGTDHAGTYIVLKGTYKGKEMNPFFPHKTEAQEATAHVTYYIHLGYIDQYGGADDLSVYRNHKYTYNVRVTGVNSIIVEAFMENSDSPRADGDVVFTDAEPIDVDAHFAKRLITFHPGEDLTQDGQVVCSVKTAATGWTETDVNQAGADIDWVYFVEKAQVEALWKQGLGPDFTFTDPVRSEGIMTIRELAAKLSGEYSETGVSVYAYIRENYYDGLSLAQFINYQSTTGSAKTRTMAIALRTKNASGSSSVSSARYIIRQKPIVAFFDMASRQVRDGQSWGMEWINESEEPIYFNASTSLYHKALNTGIAYKRDDSRFNTFGTSTSDGLNNMKTEIAGFVRSETGWKELETNRVAETGLTETGGTDYAAAYAACMSRNRDENGDGRITDDEIKWYLPAIDQYQHFWIGTNAVPEEATLYPADFRLRNNANTDPNFVREMFTMLSSGGHRFFADEAFGVRMNDSGRHARNHLRCARNIGSGSKVEVAHVSDGADSKTYAISGYLTESSLRDPLTSGTTLPSHNEYSPWNRLPSKLEVKKTSIKANVLPEGGVYVKLLQYVHEGKGLNNPCHIYNTGSETGWRVPNERELILFTTLGYLGGERLFTQTFSSLWDFDNWTRSARREENGVITPASRYGYLYNTTELQLPFNDNGIAWAYDFTCNIRCVRDVE